MGEIMFIQAGDVGGQGPVNGEFGPNGFVDHGSRVGPDGSVHNTYGTPADASADAERSDGSVEQQRHDDAEADDDQPPAVKEDIVTHFEDPSGSTTNVVAKGARVAGRIIQMGDGGNIRL